MDAEHRQNWNKEEAHVPYDQLQPYIQDCLDLIEFANGPADSEWGKKRAEMGHPEPFNMKFIGVGNEQWDDMYFKRLEPFVTAIKAKYPNIQIVGTSGPDSEGKMFEKGWAAMKKQKADLVDEHFYRPESWFLATPEGKERYGNCGASRYDSYDRKGPKVFAGEYACHGKNRHKWNHYATTPTADPITTAKITVSTARGSPRYRLPAPQELHQYPRSQRPPH